MGLGTDVRLARLFSHPSGNLFGIAVDHFVGYGNVREGGLANLPEAVNRFRVSRKSRIAFQARSAVRSQENIFTRCFPYSESSSRKGLSVMARTSCFLSDSGFAVSKSISSRPATSGNEELLAAMAGAPHAIASNNGRPNPSYNEGNTNA